MYESYNFYSCQSDLPAKINRYFMEDVTKKSLKEIDKDNIILTFIDRDIMNELASLDIRTSI